MSFKKITAATMMLGLATSASAAELIITLEKGAESVGKAVEYVEYERGNDRREIVSVSHDSVEAVLSLLRQHNDVETVERNQSMSIPKPVESPQSIESASYLEPTPSPEGFSDPGFRDQYGWVEYDADNAPGGSTVTKAVRASETYEPLNVVVIDGGFTPVSSFEWKGGYNFINDKNNPKIGPDYPGTTRVNYDGGLTPGEQFITDPSTDCTQRHGQKVASVIGGKQGDQIGNTGILSQGNFYAARVADCGGATNTDLTANAIRWAVGEQAVDENGNTIPEDDIGQKADIINISLAGEGECSTSTQDAINTAVKEHGAVVVVSAGNGQLSADNISPGNCNNVITVAATNEQGAAALFTNKGDAVDVSASGVSVPVYSGLTDEREAGTSFSAPMVSGIVANLKQDIPGLTPETIQKDILPNAVNIPPALAGSTGMGDGLIDASKLQQAAVDTINPPDFELRHPAGGDCGGTQMLNTLAQAQGNSVCDLREIRVNTDLEANGKHAVVYELPADAEMTVGNGRVFQASQAERFMLNNWDGSKQYGIQKCDGEDGTGCNDSDALIPLDMDGVRTQCSI